MNCKSCSKKQNMLHASCVCHVSNIWMFHGVSLVFASSSLHVLHDVSCPRIFGFQFQGIRRAIQYSYSFHGLYAPDSEAVLSCRDWAMVAQARTALCNSKLFVPSLENRTEQNSDFCPAVLCFGMANYWQHWQEAALYLCSRF